MGRSRCRPTAQDIEELIDLVRRDPSSPAFIDSRRGVPCARSTQGCGRCRQPRPRRRARQPRGQGDIARAFAAMHQWKEAQGELLRVVKVDRSNRAGFALLGEVLLRRSDYERAVPVLQHAQNLDPTSPSLLAMLKRARSGQALIRRRQSRLPCRRAARPRSRCLPSRCAADRDRPRP